MSARESFTAVHTECNLHCFYEPVTHIPKLHVPLTLRAFVEDFFHFVVNCRRVSDLVQDSRAPFAPECLCSMYSTFAIVFKDSEFALHSAGAKN